MRVLLGVVWQGQSTPPLEPANMSVPALHQDKTREARERKRSCDLAPPKRKTPEANARGSSIIICVGRNRLRNDLHHPFALGFLPGQFTGTANRLGLFARFFLGGLLEMLLELHFPKHAFALQFLLQGTKRLIDVIVANTNLH